MKSIKNAADIHDFLFPPLHIFKRTIVDHFTMEGEICVCVLRTRLGGPQVLASDTVYHWGALKATAADAVDPY